MNLIQSSIEISGQEITRPMLSYLAGLGPRTRPVVMSTLRAMAHILTDGSRGPEEIAWWRLDPIQIGVLRSELQRRYSPNTANMTLTSLRGVLKAAWREGLIDQATLERLTAFRKVPGNAIRKGRMLERDEIMDISKATDQGYCSAIAYRDKAIVAVLFGAGLRRSEIVDLDLEHYSNGSLHVVMGKNGKSRVVPLGGATASLDAWVAVRGSWVGPLFCPVRKGELVRKRLGRTTLPRVVERLTRRTGVERWTAHDGRRTYISALLDSGSDLGLAAALAGHTDPRVTALYDRRPQAARVRAVERLQLPL